MAKRNKDWLKMFMDYTENTEPSDNFKLWSGISVIAAALERKTYTDWGQIIYPNMFIVIVGPSGSRKGTAMAPAEKIMHQVEDIDIAPKSVSKEALVETFIQSTKSLPGDLIGVHSSITIFSEELSVFLGHDNRELITWLTDWYDCKSPWEYKTKGRGSEKIENLWLNLLGATTPESLVNDLPTSAIGGGLTSRIVFVYEPSKKKAVALPGYDDRLESKLVKSLRNIHNMVGKFRYTEESLKAYVAWYNQNHDKQPIHDPRFANYSARRATHIRKLAMILSASSRDDMVVTEEVFVRAINFLEDAEKLMGHTFRGYGESSSSEILTKIMKMIAFQNEISRKQLLSKFYYDLENVDHLDQILNTLEQAEFCDLVHDGSQTLVSYRETSEN